MGRFARSAALLCAVALVSFAANSVLCRVALRSRAIDPATFTLVRLTSGALILAVLVCFARQKSAATSGLARLRSGSWLSGVALWLYAAVFSFAYLGLTAGTGALLLFGAVQLTMITVGLTQSSRPRPLEWFGLAAGLGGLVYLVLPGLASPPPLSAALMLAAGAAWGFYSLRGRGNRDPVGATAANFLWSAPLAVALWTVLAGRSWASSQGLALAACSGAVTSGLGYAAWYSAVRHMSAHRAAIVQLSVPVLAALGGVAFLGEPVSTRLIVASVVVLGGVALALTAKSKKSSAT